MSILLRPATRRSHLKTYDRKPGHPLDFLPSDPYHDKTDVMRQMFYQQPDGYAKRQTPQMNGFVWNKRVHEIMWTYTPYQLPVINGLARDFFFNDTATTEIYTLSLHDALPTSLPLSTGGE